ncbi:MAG: trypsin-like peptidase domain-containing protein, partial [Ignavibacteriae bacterium]|nr:trypsin-like peptidase domain-containing protein [Ignavibacteriota bacterium]
MKKISLILIALIFIFNCNLFSQNAEKVISINKKSLVSIFSAEKVYVTYKDYISYNFVYDTTVLYGSGFFIDKQGYIATCLHVVDNIDSILVKTYDSIYYYAEIISADIKNDLAIIKIKNANQIFHPVTLGNSDNIKIGEECFTIGNPLGYENTISKGIVAGIRTNQKIEFGLNEIKVFDKVIQTDAAISPGNSGGAMFNSKGEVIGITAYCESSLFFGTFGNLIFAVAINTLKELSKNMGSHEHLINDSLNIILKNNYLDKYLAKASKYKSEIVHNLKLLDARDTSVTNDTLKSKLDSLNNIYINKANELYDICFRIKPDTFIVYFELVDLYIKIEDYTKANMIFDTLYIKFQNDST